MMHVGQCAVVEIDWHDVVFELSWFLLKLYEVDFSPKFCVYKKNLTKFVENISKGLSKQERKQTQLKTELRNL